MSAYSEKHPDLCKLVDDSEDGRLKTTNRFSEDIDLSVDTRDCSRSQNDKRLEQASKKYSALPRSPEEGRTNRSEVISVYHYDPVVPYDSDDALRRFGKLKIEATSFTISEPVTELEISAMIYELANEHQKRILEDRYNYNNHRGLADCGDFMLLLIEQCDIISA